MASEGVKSVVVLGAGVVGLTTALLAQETGKYKVTVIAETLPSDPKSIRYTSPWAGAHHVSLAGNDQRQRKIDQETFDKFWELSAPEAETEGLFLRLDQTEYYAEEKDEPQLPYPELRALEKHELRPQTVAGINFKTVTIDSPRYLNWLLSRFLSKGGSIVRGSVQHISQVIEGGATIFEQGKKIPSPPDAIIVALGLGARFLGGVEDKTMYPIRGQIVLLKSPWVQFGRTISSKSGLWTYIIPRRSGGVIVGGIKDVDDWYPVPRPETTRDILERALALCPELAPESVRASREPTVEDLLPLVIEPGCGFRPARKDGIRLETEIFEDKINQRKVPVIHNYGHGGYGYQSSWGSANFALKLLEEAIGTK